MNNEYIDDTLRYATGQYYTVEKNKQILLYLLKQWGIKKVVVSPGATNYALVGSMQHDAFFEMYSCVDERGASYMALGMAKKAKEPVIISCTGATSSRNYMAALTEAYYSKIPILVVTSSLSQACIGHLRAQVTDRSHAPIDTCVKSITIDNIKDEEDVWSATVKINEALSLLKNGPVHINICTTYTNDFSCKELPVAKYIPLYESAKELPSLPNGRIAIFIGSHKKFTERQTQSIERFCKNHNAVVLADHTSGYYGKFRLNMALPFFQGKTVFKENQVNLLIHLGEISGDYYTFGRLRPAEVWRVSDDGAYRDFFKSLTKVFAMSEECFFDAYCDRNVTTNDYYNDCQELLSKCRENLPEVGFSNIWMASQLSQKLPADSVIHFGILNSLRSCDFFDLPVGVESASNVGGFGIDGCVSSVIGAAMVNPDKLYFCVVGDLTMFYDINSLLTKDLPKNLRILVINNGRGTEFRNYNHLAKIAFGNSVDAYIAACAHNGAQSHTLLKGICENCGIDYVACETKPEFEAVIDKFTTRDIDRSIVIEAFTDSDVESDALKAFSAIIVDPLPKRGIRKIKRIMKIKS